MKKLLIAIIFGAISIGVFSQAAKVPMGVGTKLATAFPIINRAIDTLNTYIVQIPLKLDIADTSAMLAGYARLMNPLFINFVRVNSDTLATRDYVRATIAGGGVPGILAQEDSLGVQSDINYVTKYRLSSVIHDSATLRLYKGDTASMLLHYVDRTDNIAKLSKTDTATMLAHYAKLTGVALKLNISDTAGMLTHYIDRTDNLAKVSVSDTATMLTKYARKLSPTLTGTPLAPTAAAGTNTTQIATTAFVRTAGLAKVNVADSVTGANSYATDHRADLIEAKQNNASTGIFNVLDYGADNAGVVDATTAIQNAINAIPSNGGTLVFPPGWYRVSTPVIISKPVNLQGTKVMRWAYPDGSPDGYFAYEGGSVIQSYCSGEDVITITDGSVDSTDNEYAGSNVSNLHFQDMGGFNDTLLKIFMVSNVRVEDCTFSMGAAGIIIDPNGDIAGEDASWNHLINNEFTHNKIGVHVKTATIGGIPFTLIKGGAFDVDNDQTGIKMDDAAFSILEGFKIDLAGVTTKVNSIGISWKGEKGSITDVKIETGGVDTTVIGIDVFGLVNMSGIGIQDNDGHGVGIKIEPGTALSSVNSGNVILNSQITGGALGVWCKDTTQATTIADSYFSGQTVANIRLDAGSRNNFLNGIVATKLPGNAGGLLDNSTNTSIVNYTLAQGGDRLTYPFVLSKMADANLAYYTAGGWSTTSFPEGAFYYNTTRSRYEVYNSGWSPLASDRYIRGIVSITAANGLTVTPQDNIITIRGIADNDTCIVSHNPQIIGGTTGQMIELWGEYTIAPVKFHNGDGLHLGAASRKLAWGDVLVLRYFGYDGEWREVSFTDNQTP